MFMGWSRSPLLVPLNVFEEQKSRRKGEEGAKGRRKEGKGRSRGKRERRREVEVRVTAET